MTENKDFNNDDVITVNDWGLLRLGCELDLARKSGGEELKKVLCDIAEEDLLDYFGVREEYEKLK